MSGAEPRPVLDAFLDQAARSPETTALTVGGTTLTYRELDRASAELAALLAGHGAGPGTVVGIRLEPSALAVVAVLATLRVGAAFSALEPDLPASRLVALCEDTDCVAVLAEDREPLLKELAHPPVLLEAAALGLPGLIAAGSATAAPLPPVPGDSPAYVIYTSGSTGKPKGVTVSRDQLAASVSGRGGVYGSRHSVFVMAMRLSFDGMLGGMFWSFTRGHTLVLPDARELLQPREFIRLAGAHRATHLIAVPSYYRALLEEPDALPDSLRLVVVAGEACTPELVAAHREKLPDAQLANEYGPTETTISVTVELDPDAAWTRIPIGRTWPGATARVLDDRLRQVPPGELGELYIGGSFVAQGYANQPAKTAERFVADPYGPPGARVYRTGDLARVDERGALHYHGRTDDQVKIRGARIEIGEVENVLERHPAIAQAVVVCRKPARETDDPRLTAFLLPASTEGVVPDTHDLRRHCRAHLVEQAVPVAFHPVTRIPLSSSGKADRAALLKHVAAPPPTAGDRGDPNDRDDRNDRNDRDDRNDWDDWGDRDGHRRAVGEIWAQVLRHSGAGPHDNFFAVGGSSLRVIDLHKRLEERWPSVLRVGELFDLITIADQADTIADRLGRTGQTDHPDEAGAEALDAEPPPPAAYEL